MHLARKTIINRSTMKEGQPSWGRWLLAPDRIGVNDVPVKDKITLYRPSERCLMFKGNLKSGEVRGYESRDPFDPLGLQQIRAVPVNAIFYFGDIALDSGQLVLNREVSAHS